MSFWERSESLWGQELFFQCCFSALLFHIAGYGLLVLEENTDATS